MNDNYYKYFSLQVNQIINKHVLITKIPFLELIEITKFTAREPQIYDPFDPYKNFDKVANDLNRQYYQRLLNDKKTRTIEDFLLAEISNRFIPINHQKSRSDIDQDAPLEKYQKVPLGTFPTSMIIAIDSMDEISTVEEFDSLITLAKEKNNKKEYSLGAMLFEEYEDKNFADLLIPRTNNALIVDGQHRLAGLRRLYLNAKDGALRLPLVESINVTPELYNEYIIKQLEGFDFICTILLGFDFWEQGKIFADVNFNQKPVNKSIYYDIFGSYPDPNKNEIYLSHLLTMYLNNNINSVLKGKIKMLGTGAGLISQAFFVENLLPLFDKKNIWGDLPFDYLLKGEKHKFLPKFFAAYFAVIKEVFSKYWPTDNQNSSRSYPNILLKTTGVGALLRLVQDIYRHLESSVNFSTITEDILKNKFRELLKPIQKNGENYFSNASRYAGAGSRGLQTKLYLEIKNDLGL